MDLRFNFSHFKLEGTNLKGHTKKHSYNTVNFIFIKHKILPGPTTGAQF